MQCTSYLHNANSRHSTRPWPVLRPQEEDLWLVEMKVLGDFSAPLLLCYSQASTGLCKSDQSACH